MASRKLELVGPVEIAELLKVRQSTVYRWRDRKRLPEPEWMPSGGPIWRKRVILDWARRTNRLHDQEEALVS